MIDMEWLRHIGFRTAVFSAIALSASHAASGNLSSAINSLESITQTLLLVLSAVFLLLGIALTGAGLFLYMKKVKGAYKPATKWKIAAFSSGGLGVILLLSGIMGFTILLLTPIMIRGLLS